MDKIAKLSMQERQELICIKNENNLKQSSRKISGYAFVWTTCFMNVNGKMHLRLRAARLFQRHMG